MKGLKSAVENFEFQYVLKIDTDSYVSVGELVDYLLSYNNKTNLYIGIEQYFLSFKFTNNL